MTEDRPRRRPAVLVTGAGRLVGIAAGVAGRLADDGWDIALNYWKPYDASLPWTNGVDTTPPTDADEEVDRLANTLRGGSARRRTWQGSSRSCWPTTVRGRPGS